VYVTGGAQGAHRINRVVGDALASLTEQAQLIISAARTCTGDRRWLEDRRAALPPALARRYTVVPYIGAELAGIYAAATLVVARAGRDGERVLPARRAGAVRSAARTRGDEQTENARIVERVEARRAPPVDAHDGAARSRDSRAPRRPAD